MLIDKQNQLSDGQAVTSTGSTASTNVIDLGIARDVGGAVSDRLMLLCEVGTTFTSGGSATLKVQVQTSPDNSTWITLAQSDDVPVAQLGRGFRFLPGPLPGGTSRYLRLNYVVGAATMTGGALNAALVPSLDVQRSYASAYAA